MGKYFGREPRSSREEVERQAQEAIDARVSLGRPPAEDWAPLEARLAEIDQAIATRPPMPVRLEHEPIQIHEVRVPKAPAPAVAPRAIRVRQPAGAQRGAD